MTIPTWVFWLMLVGDGIGLLMLIGIARALISWNKEGM